jgi:Zn-dependent protease
MQNKSVDLNFQMTPGFILLLSYLTFHDDMFIMLIIAALLHELAHIAATLILGGTLLSCRLSVTGALINIGRLSYGREAVAVAAGPLVSIIAAFVTAPLGWHMFAGVSLSLGLFNLMPARELDGGRLAELFFSRHGKSSHGILSALTVFSALFMAIPVALAFMNGIYNYTMALFAAYLFFGEIYGQFTHARTKARAIHGRRNRQYLERVG